MTKKSLYAIAFLFLATTAFGKTCEGFGPQTPRDITSKGGTNPVQFNFAPSYKEMNL